MMAPRRAAALRDGAERSLREHLVAVAERLVARRGVAGLSVREIAREAGVAIGVLYNHFGDKEELLALALHAHVRAVEAGLGDPPGPPGSGTVRANLTAYLTRGLALHAAIVPAFAGLPGEPGVLARFTALPNPAAGGQGLREELADYLRAESRLGRVAAGTDPQVIATLIIGVCHEMVLPRLYGGPTSGPVEASPEFVAEVVGTVLEGIAPAR